MTFYKLGFKLGIMDISDKLKQYGLNDKETRFYLAALALGTAFITQLANQ